MIQCLIIDDEPLARSVLKVHLSPLPGWNVVKECTNALEAFEILPQGNIDVIFLDIQMPGIQGNDFVRALKKPPLVIFTTAHATYAVEGFELNAVDYLLKPITAERLEQATKKVELILNRQQEQHTKNQAKEFIFIKQENRQVKIWLDDILFLEAKRDFTQLQLKDRKLLAGFHLKILEGMLPEHTFMRVHRSFIINLKAIDALLGTIVEINGFQIPVGNTYKETLHSALKI